MSNYQTHWDLSTIPEDVFASEHGRRNRAKGPDKPALKLQPCSKCGHNLSAQERRKPCPKCDWRNVKRDSSPTGGWHANPYIKAAKR